MAEFGRLIIDQKNDVRNEIRELERENDRIEKKFDKNEQRIRELISLLEEWDSEVSNG